MYINIERIGREISRVLSGKSVGRIPPEYQKALWQWITNLKVLRDRTERGDLTALDDFFGVYGFDDSGFTTYRRQERQPRRDENEPER